MSPALLSGSGSLAPAHPSGGRGRGGCWPQSRKVGQWRSPGTSWGWPELTSSKGAVYPTRPVAHLSSLPLLPSTGVYFQRLAVCKVDKAAFFWSSAPGKLVYSFKIVRGHEGSKFSLPMTCNKIRSCEVQAEISLLKCFSSH